jgi:hypothetical protein
LQTKIKYTTPNINDSLPHKRTVKKHQAKYPYHTGIETLKCRKLRNLSFQMEEEQSIKPHVLG